MDRYTRLVDRYGRTLGRYSKILDKYNEIVHRCNEILASYYLIIHCCLNIGTSIVTVRAVTERDEVVGFRYSPDRYDTGSNIQKTMSNYSVS